MGAIFGIRRADHHGKQPRDLLTASLPTKNSIREEAGLSHGILPEAAPQSIRIFASSRSMFIFTQAYYDILLTTRQRQHPVQQQLNTHITRLFV